MTTPDAAADTFTFDPAWLSALGVGALLPRSLSQWEPLVLEGLARFGQTQ